MTAFFKGLGVYASDEKLFLFYHSLKNDNNHFSLDYSKDGKDFVNLSSECAISTEKGIEDISKISTFRFYKTGDIYHLYYLSEQEGKKYLIHATSADFIKWDKKEKLFPITSAAVKLNFKKYKDQELLFFGDRSLNIGTSTDNTNWNINKIDTPDKNYLVGCITETKKGDLLTFFVKDVHNEHDHFSIWSVLLDYDDPLKVLWKTDRAIWYQPQEWINIKLTPVGIVEFKDSFYSFWEYPGKGIFRVSHDQILNAVENNSTLPHACLIRSEKNPILSPKDEIHWESKQVFNPAAVYHNKSVHLLYRAIGVSDSSVLGYARSDDGLNIDTRDKNPAYIPRAHFEGQYPKTNIQPSPFESGGGGYGGIEDPRISKIDDYFYLTYVAYDGASPPRVALSYISVDSFENKNWEDWSEPILISPPGIVDKNACLLPEKVNGKYVLFHRIYPDILIDMVDNLEDFDGKNIWLEGKYRIHPRPDFWDSNKVGMGPPPIKTKDGWLAIYQGVGFHDNYRYKIGAMLLDLDDPSKVLYRSTHPILEPLTSYENNGFKSGVVYPCGAVVIDNRLIVYYGGSDTYVAAATAELDQFLDELKFDSQPHLDSVIMEEVNYGKT